MSDAGPQDAGVPFDDRGLAYGDGLFETVLVRDGQPLLWDYHLARLQRGCAVLGMDAPAEASLAALPAAAGSGLAVLKMIVTRGSGGRGYQPPAEPEPRLRWQLSAFEPRRERWQHGVAVRHCRLRLAEQPALAGIKHLNRLENVLARREWSSPEIAEGLLSSASGRLIEATSMNVFWRRDGRWQTPPLERCGVAGTLRAALLERLDIDEVELESATLEAVEGLCLGNSVQGVWPVTALESASGEPLGRWSITSDWRAFQQQAHALLGYPSYS
ncbi:aminodeoxychorismate lyase [Halomonas sp. HP20-15]|uniref:aminodeoxychorismate lyase n=1 Tax=Halomonas sp. HP20-15 TaxID=3085901 RepID=UPI0029822158|nr:aminodeoxychorismate lyase [Halomonas sp. HP20-15]MDW5378891.1 aminodeoxychorismate lyase [Halomonas sp. HP20-15]